MGIWWAVQMKVDLALPRFRMTTWAANICPLRAFPFVIAFVVVGFGGLTKNSFS